LVLEQEFCLYLGHDVVLIPHGRYCRTTNKAFSPPVPILMIAMNFSKLDVYYEVFSYINEIMDVKLSQSLAANDFLELLKDSVQCCASDYVFYNVSTSI
jgi:hypothetical protein